MSDPLCDLLEWAIQNDALQGVTDAQAHAISLAVSNDWEYAVKDEWVMALAHYRSMLARLEKAEAELAEQKKQAEYWNRQCVKAEELLDRYQTELGKTKLELSEMTSDCTSWMERAERAEADRERLSIDRTIFAERCSQNREDIVYLKAERDRLREVLGRIAHNHDCDPRAEAREALEEKP